MTAERAPLFIILAVVLGALAGLWAGPVLARADQRVGLAARLHLEESERLAERTLRSDAFRRTGEPLEGAYRQARAVERRFRLGATVLGAWFGLMLGLRFVSLGRGERHAEYAVNPAACVACTRCFSACPRERRRRKAQRSVTTADHSDEG